MKWLRVKWNQFLSKIGSSNYSKIVSDSKSDSDVSVLKVKEDQLSYKFDENGLELCYCNGLPFTGFEVCYYDNGRD